MTNTTQHSSYGGDFEGICKDTPFAMQFKALYMGNGSLLTQFHYVDFDPVKIYPEGKRREEILVTWRMNLKN